MSEAEQIAQARRGDDEAWVSLVRHHQDAVFRLAYLLLDDADDAADVAQEVFVRAWRARHRLDVDRPLRPWLLQITRNQCFNWRRSARRYLALLGRWGLTQPLMVDPEEQFTQAWQATALWQAVRQLRPADQEMIYLRCFLDLSVEETAAVVAAPSGTVKSRLSRALARLRALIERDLPDLGRGEREGVAE